MGGGSCYSTMLQKRQWTNMKNKITLVKKEQWFNMKKLNYVDLMPKSSIIIIMIYLQQLKIQAPTFYDKKLYIYLHAR